MNLLIQYNCTRLLEIRWGVKRCVRYIKNVLFQDDAVNWHTSLRNDTGNVKGNKLHTYRKYKCTPFVDFYIQNILHRDHRRILAKFWCGIFPFFVETCRYSKPPIPLSERLCKYRNWDLVEDECHLLLPCSFNEDLQHDLYCAAEENNRNYNVICEEEKNC